MTNDHARNEAIRLLRAAQRLTTGGQAWTRLAPDGVVRAATDGLSPIAITVSCSAAVDGLMTAYVFANDSDGAPVPGVRAELRLGSARHSAVTGEHGTAVLTNCPQSGGLVVINRLGNLDRRFEPLVAELNDVAAAFKRLLAEHWSLEPADTTKQPFAVNELALSRRGAAAGSTEIKLSLALRRAIGSRASATISLSDGTITIAFSDLAIAAPTEVVIAVSGSDEAAADLLVLDIERSVAIVKMPWASAAPPTDVHIAAR